MEPGPRADVYEQAPQWDRGGTDGALRNDAEDENRHVAINAVEALPVEPARQPPSRCQPVRA